ncbi:MAG: hypothetical protein KGL68_03110 [Burkholderiales bacterium]|nr:hypothetical protein [Burkholderiales bacterium]
MKSEGTTSKLVAIAGGRLQIERPTQEDGEALITVTAKAAQEVAAFDSFLDALVRQSPAFQRLGVAEQMVACVVALEDVAVEDVHPMLAATSNPTILPDGYYVSWKVGNEMRRCKLSPLTVLALKKVDPEKVKWQATIDSFSRNAAQIYPFRQTGRIDARLQEMLWDRAAWQYLHLPMPVVAHLTGLVRLTLLPDTAWLRRFGLPVPSPELDAALEPELAEVQESIAEAVYSGEKQLSGAWFVDELLKACSGLIGTGVQLSDAAAWRSLVGRLRDLGNKLKTAGPIEALLLGWTLDIATFGSARKKNPRVKTLANYLNSAARKLHNALRETGKSPLDMTDEDWEEFFEGLDVAESDDANLRPALASFQRYLVRSIDAKPIPRLWAVNAQIRAPRANVVWPHEFDAVEAEVARLTFEPRVRDQLAVWNFVLRKTPLRFGELVGLQLRSIRILEGAVEIAVAPHGGLHPLKTPSARRILPVGSVQEVQLLLDWLERRRVEGASTEDLLFGDPAAPKRLFKIGLCYRVYSSALKTVTGDPTVVVHSTRHAFLSAGVESRLLEIEVSSLINPLQELTAWAGHKSVGTTFSTYAHLVERVFRHWTDEAIQKHLTRHVDAARWIGCSPEPLRQRLHRKGAQAWSLWQEIVEATGTAPSLIETHRTGPARASISTAPISRFRQFVRVAHDLSEVVDPTSVALRNSVTADSVEAVLAVLQGDFESSMGSKVPWRRKAEALNFSRLSRPGWDNLISAMETPVDRAALAAVCGALRPSGIDLDGAARFLGEALRVLKSAGFAANRFVIRYAQEEGAPALAPLTVMKAQARFEGVYGATPQVERVRVRRSRPASYLLLLANPTDGTRCAPAASSDLRTLRAVAVCAAAYDEFLRRSDGSAAQEDHSN